MKSTKVGRVMIWEVTSDDPTDDEVRIFGSLDQGRECFRNATAKVLPSFLSASLTIIITPPTTKERAPHLPLLDKIACNGNASLALSYLRQAYTSPMASSLASCQTTLNTLHHFQLRKPEWQAHA